jgi:hypothetical protein
VTRNGVEVWVELYTINPKDYTMTIIERTPMQQVIKADAMAAALDKEGFIALDIHFATGRAEILPESRPIIDEIVTLLKKRPNPTFASVWKAILTVQELRHSTRRYQTPAQNLLSKPSPPPGSVLTGWIR